MRTILMSAVVAVVVAPATAPTRAADDLTAILSRPILHLDQPLTDFRRFCEERIPRIEAFDSAEKWESYANDLRAKILDGVVFRGEAAAWRDAKCGVEWLETIEGGPGYSIKKLRYEALPGLWVPALLYEPDGVSGKVPACLAVNGHDGRGKALPYKQVRCINLAKRGMLVLNLDWLAMGQLSHADNQHWRLNQLDLCGTSGLAPFYLSMSRGLDVLLAHENADPARVSVSGLSGGGWQTIVISSLDTRVTLANPVAGYSSYFTRLEHFKDLGDSEQLPCDLGLFGEYTHLTALRAPRPTLLTYNSADECCFEAGYALSPLVEAAHPIYRLLGREAALDSHINFDPGTHNYDQDNRQAFYAFVGRHFYPDDSGFNADEIPSDAEIKSAEELEIELPEPNATLHSLAVDVASRAPREAEVPAEPSAAWKSSQRAMLREIVRPIEYQVKAEQAGIAEHEDVRARLLWLKLGQDWTVPAVELVKGEPKATAIVLADEGRSTATARVEALLNDGRRVLAVDLFACGESRMKVSANQLLLLMDSLGSRPLGVQASQLAAIARWARSTYNVPTGVSAMGPRTCTIALVAAGLEERTIEGLRLTDPLGSFHELIEQNKTAADLPELFCFGLLAEFDVPHLLALAAPRNVITVAGDPNAVLDAAIAAHGGEAAIQKMRSVRRTLRLRMGGDEDDDLAILKIARHWPERLKWDLTVLNEPALVAVKNGADAWIREQDATRDMPAEEMAGLQAHDDLSLLVLLRAKQEAQSLTAIPDVEVSGRRAAGIQVEFDGLPPTKLYFDRRTRLLARFDRPDEGERKSPLDFVTVDFSEYRDVQGLKLWHLMTAADGLTSGLRIEQSEVEFVDTFDDAEFAKP